MCVEEYVGCPSCYRAADDGMYEVAYQTEEIHYPLDSDGDQDHNQEVAYDENPQMEYNGYGCECGWRGQSLDDRLSRDECECSECVEVEYDCVDAHLADDDAYVQLYRCPDDLSELPHELRILAEDRCMWVALMPRWRSAELYSDWSHLIRVDYEPDFSIPESVARAAMPNYPAYDDREVCTA